MKNRQLVLERLKRGLVYLEACEFDGQVRTSPGDTDSILWDKDYENGFLAFYQALEALEGHPNADGIEAVRDMMTPLRNFYSHPPDVRSELVETEPIRLVNPNDDGTGIREVIIHIRMERQTAYTNWGRRRVDWMPSKQTLIDCIKKLIYHLEERFEQGGKIAMSASLGVQQ